jgi:3-hydroxybutyryl-CoA dehydrogenase
LPPLESSRLVELTGQRSDEVEAFFRRCGFHTEWVGDAPGLVLGRIIAQVVNEAAFALGEGVGSAEDIDAGLIHGLNYPRGVLHWADEIGLDQILAILDALYEERHEERYRVAPVLRRLVWSGRLGRQTGEGFFTYEE